MRYLYENKYLTTGQIARKLDVDKDYLEEAIRDTKDIDRACNLAIKERNAKVLLKTITDMYSTTYLYSHDIPTLLRNQIKLEDKKRDLVKEIKLIIDESMNDYLLFNEDTLNLLLVNTTKDIDKRVLDDDEVDSIDFLRSVANGSFYSNPREIVEDSNPFNGREVKSNVIFNSINNGGLVLSKSNTLVLLEFLDEVKLPIKYNERITDSISNKEISDVKTLNLK